MMSNPSTEDFSLGVSSYNMEYTVDWDPKNSEFRILEGDLKIKYRKSEKGVLRREKFEYENEEKANVVDEAMRSRLEEQGWSIR